MGVCARGLKMLPGVLKLSADVIARYKPVRSTQEPVTLTRQEFDALVLCALVGIETVMEEPDATKPISTFH